MKFIQIFLFFLILIGVGLLLTIHAWVPPLTSWILGQEQGTHAPVVSSTSVSDYKNATYSIEGQSVTLTNGQAETEAAPGSASKTVTHYFGNEAFGDLNGDGTPDVAFILTQTGGGSGTFYYVVVALATSARYHGTNAILLGDRIAPQTTEISNGQVIVNYADRKGGEPMSTQPSVGVSKYFRVVGNILTPVK